MLKQQWDTLLTLLPSNIIYFTKQQQKQKRKKERKKIDGILVRVTHSVPGSWKNSSIELKYIFGKQGE